MLAKIAISCLHWLKLKRQRNTDHHNFTRTHDETHKKGRSIPAHQQAFKYPV